MGIKETIQLLVKDLINIQVQAGKVLCVDEKTMTCDIAIEGEPDRLDVRLTSVIDSSEKGILVVPVVGSYVLLGLIDNKEESAFVFRFSEVKSIKLIVDKIQLSGDELGGLVVSEKVTNEVNELKKEINMLKGLFSSWVVAPSDGGAVLKALVTTWAGQNLVAIKKEKIENSKVKHG